LNPVLGLADVFYVLDCVRPQPALAGPFTSLVAATGAQEAYSARLVNTVVADGLGKVYATTPAACTR
jgi:hypothetical protein